MNKPNHTARKVRTQRQKTLALVSGGLVLVLCILLGTIWLRPKGGAIDEPVIMDTRKLPHYTLNKPLILVVVTSDLNNRNSTIWLIRINGEGLIDRHKLIEAYSNADNFPENPLPWSSQGPFHLLQGPLSSGKLYASERLEMVSDHQRMKLHSWSIQWPLEQGPTIQSEEQLLTLPASARPTAVISQELYYDDTLGIYRLEFASGTIAQIATTSSEIQCSSPGLSPQGAFLAEMCLTRVNQGSPASPYTSTGQHIRILNLDGSGQRVLTPADKNTYPFVSLSSFAYGIAPPVSPNYAWSSDETQVAFVAALEPPRLLNPVEQPPATYEDSGTIYSFSLQDGVLQKWVRTYGHNPQLAWSPDSRFIAYSLGNKLNLVSIDREQRTIREYDDTLDGVLWSSDGSYIAVKHTSYIAAKYTSRLEIIRTSDYSSQSVDLPGEVSEINWVTP